MQDNRTDNEIREEALLLHGNYAALLLTQYAYYETYLSFLNQLGLLV